VYQVFGRFCAAFEIDPQGKGRKQKLAERIWSGSSGLDARETPPAVLQRACGASAEIVLHVLEAEAEARKVASPPVSPYCSSEALSEGASGGAMPSPASVAVDPGSTLLAFERQNERVRRDLLYAVRAGLSSLAVEHERKAALHGELYEAQCTIMALQRQVEAMQEVIASPQGMRYAGSESSDGGESDGGGEIRPLPGPVLGPGRA